MLELDGKRILCVSAHLDDSEFGCGGLVAKYAERAEIHFFGMSLNRKSFHGEVQEVREMAEQYAALDALGIPRERFHFNDEVAGQMLPEYRQLVLEELYRAGREVQPELVLVPSRHDIHHDHRTVSEMALKAFKRASVWGYEIVNSATGFAPNLYISLEPEHVERKAAAVACYHSQHSGGMTTGDYFSNDLMMSLAKVRGARAGTALAEAFEVYTLID
ncbi:PIG-L deacetylase family protein [Endothiovibrio diazotrophicus]